VRRASHVNLAQIAHSVYIDGIIALARIGHASGSLRG